MGLLSDIKKRFNAVPSNGLDGYGERSTSQHGARGRSAHASQHAGRGMSSSRQASRRPHGPDASSGSQDSGVVMHKESSVNLSSVPDYACPNCAAAAAARHAHPRPSMEAMQAYSSSKALPPLAHDHRMPDMSHDHSRPGTGYSNNSVLQPMQSQPYRQQPPHQNHDPGFSSRPVSWGRRATTDNVGQDVPSGYSRPVTPPYSVTSEQTGWNSGQQYNNIPGPPSLDGRSNNRPVSWRRATDQRGPGYYPDTAGSSRAPSEAGSNHPRNQSKNMESSAYEAGFRDAIARLRADAERW